MKKITRLTPCLLLTIGFVVQKIYLVTLLEMFTHHEKVDNTALEWEAIACKHPKWNCGGAGCSAGITLHYDLITINLN